MQSPLLKFLPPMPGCRKCPLTPLRADPVTECHWTSVFGANWCLPSGIQYPSDLRAPSPLGSSLPISPLDTDKDLDKRAYRVRPLCLNLLPRCQGVLLPSPAGGRGVGGEGSQPRR